MDRDYCLVTYSMSRFRVILPASRKQAERLAAMPSRKLLRGPLREVRIQIPGREAVVRKRPQAAARCGNPSRFQLAGQGARQGTPLLLRGRADVKDGAEAAPTTGPPVAKAQQAVGPPARARSPQQTRADEAPLGEWLSADEAYRYLRLPSRKALYQAVRRGQVPVHRLGRRMRFKRSELDQVLE